MAPQELTPAWLTARLGIEVAAVEADRIGDGLVGMNLRLRLRRPDGTPCDPASVVVKLPSPDPVSRATGVALRNYEREVRFYLEVASTVGIRAPRCWYGEWDQDSGDFVLVLEDLAPAEQGDQISGCSVGEAERALDELAKLHAPRWADPALDGIDWLQRRGPEDAHNLVAIYQLTLPGFRATYGAQLTADQLALAEAFEARIIDWLDGRLPPHTVVHGDYRLDNLMFGTAAGGPSMAAVDWQTPGHGPAAADLAYFLGAGLLVDDRRANEQALVARYHAALTAGGVTGYPLERCWEDYRHEAFAGVVMSVVASQIVGSTERSQAMFTAMATRHLQHALDLDAWGLLGRNR